MFGKVLRRRWVLAVIFSFSLIYFIINIQKQIPLEFAAEEATEKPKPKLVPEAILWNQQESKINSTKLHTCRNSVQGKELLTDERGYVCRREDLDSSGCCSLDAASTKQFECSSCTKSHCCEVYEHCVSCCLQPDKQALLRRILGQVSGHFHNLFASVTDQFELCLTKCRTSSLSVQHENSYRDPRAKYCYGHEPDTAILN